MLSPGHLYASIAIAGSVLNVVLLETSLSDSIASSIAIGFIFVTRMLSLHYDWSLPRVVVDRDDDGSESDRT